MLFVVLSAGKDPNVSQSLRIMVLMVLSRIKSSLFLQPFLQNLPVCKAATSEVDALVHAVCIAHTITCTNSKEVSLVVSPSPTENKQKLEGTTTTEMKLEKYCRVTQANQEHTNQMIKKQHYSCVFLAMATVVM